MNLNPDFNEVLVFGAEKLESRASLATETGQASRNLPQLSDNTGSDNATLGNGLLITTSLIKIEVVDSDMGYGDSVDDMIGTVTIDFNDIIR